MEAQPDSLTNKPVITGVTPGTQCINSAELCALLAAAQCVSGGTVYVDSQNTVDGFQQLLALGWSDFARARSVPCVIGMWLRLKVTRRLQLALVTLRLGVFFTTTPLTSWPNARILRETRLFGP